ncbi:MAG: argininosuccinate lyase [Candidatus Korarchaeum sp.]
MYRKPGLGEQEDWLLKFTSSLEEDKGLFRAVVLTALAHQIHLFELNLVPEGVREVISLLLDALGREEEILSGDFEDVHEAVESWVLRRAGDNGGWMAYGKSRNDQVATALRYLAIRELIAILWEINRLRESLLDAAASNLELLTPAFTHLRPAQPSTASHYLLYIEQELFHHYRVIWHILRQVIDLCPLGSGPAAGSSVPLDRGRLAELLGFSGVESNTLLATGSRSFETLTLGALSSLMVMLSRVCEDLIVWSTPNFGIVELPDDHVSTSSVMPQKRNPVTLEVVRAKAGEVIGSLTAILSIIKGLPSGYNLDLQETNRHFLKALTDVRESLRVLSDLMRKIGFREVKIDETLTQFIAEEISRKRGISYRSAHSLLASALRESDWDIRRALSDLGLDLPVFEEAMAKVVRGGPNPMNLRIEIEARRRLLRDDINKLVEYEAEKMESEKRLLDLARRIVSRSPNGGNPR